VAIVRPVRLDSVSQEGALPATREGNTAKRLGIGGRGYDFSNISTGMSESVAVIVASLDALTKEQTGT
jgi:hypothetical protein